MHFVRRANTKIDNQPGFQIRLVTIILLPELNIFMKIRAF